MIPEVLVGNTATTTTTLPSSTSSLLLHGERNNTNTIITSCSTSTIPTNHHHHHHSTFFQSSSDIFRFPSSISTFTPTITPTTTIRSSGTETTLNSITNNNQHTTASDPQQNLKCPRCDSTNTKFCYYNNYNLTQPRHFCKTCRRYWTKGGALRNVPIGGGCRKNKLSTGNNSINNTTSSTMGKHYSNSSYNNKTKVSFSGLSLADINQSPTARTYGGSGGGFLESELTVPYNTQVFWSPPTTHAAGSHILSLLKSSSTQNPNPNTNHHHSNPFFTLNSDGVDTRISGGGGGNLSREVNGLDLGSGRRPSKIVGLGLNSNRVSNDCSTVRQVPSSFSINGQHHQSYNYFQKQNRDSVKVHPIGGFEEMKIRRNLNDGGQPAGMITGNNTFSSSSSLSVSKAGGTSTVVTSSSQINGGSGFGCFISSPLCWSDLCPTPSRNAAYP